LTQSVELLLDDTTDTAIRDQWDRLGDAGLPTARRREPSPSHAPHITLWAGDRLDAEVDAQLTSLFRELDLQLLIGSLMLFGPRPWGYVLVRQVVISTGLATLQQRVVQACGGGYGQFGDGQWSPHVTLARRLDVDQVGPALRALSRAPSELPATVRRARRWDGDRRIAWPLTSA
jgi:2'-5' RNA ligase